MIIRVGMAPRAEGLTYQQFSDHWRNEHAGVAGALPGLRAYVQNHAVLADGRPLLPYPGFDACSQLVFDDAATMDAAFATRTPDSELRQDELRFVQPQRLMPMLATERTVLEAAGVPDDAVKLMTFLRAGPEVTIDAVLARLDENSSTTGDAGQTILRRERLEAIPGSRGDDTAPWVDVVDVIWFADAQTASAHLQTAAADHEAWWLAAVGQVVGRRIATEVWVVGSP